MKLKKYDQESRINLSDGLPSIHFQNSGIISLNKKAYELMDLEPGNGLEIYQDEEKPKDWYIAISDASKSLICRLDEKKNKICFNSAIAARDIFKCLDNNNPPKGASLLIGKAAIKYGDLQLWPIITASYKPRFTKSTS
ncbi:MAG: hypothetical protein EOP41_06415 [Sphingobacteriaceae bacterium]|nr:MAG: hypothetical protein EOP41_06415 [Sphingobacteriaceae bacterium]